MSSESPSLCANGCGFYGAPDSHNLCSKCYKDYLKESISKSAAAAKASSGVTTAPPSTTSSPWAENNTADIPHATASSHPTTKNRCQCCKKKVGLTGFGCRCGGLFCGVHRYPEEHSCSFDFKTAGRGALAKQNPVCKGDKLDSRV